MLHFIVCAREIGFGDMDVSKTVTMNMYKVFLIYFFKT